MGHASSTTSRDRTVTGFLVRFCIGVAIVLVSLGSVEKTNAQCLEAPSINGWQPIGPKLSTVFCYDRDPLQNNELYVGTYFGGVYKSVDFGLSWCHIPTDFSNDVVFSLEIVETTPRTIYIGTQDGGVYRTTDGGFAWESRNNGLPQEAIRDVLVDPFDAQHVLACAFSGVYESFNGGESWAITATNEVFLPAVEAVFDPNEEGRVYVVTQGLGIFRSTDGGTSWSSFDEPLSPNLVMTSIAWDVNDSHRLLASSSAGVFELKRGENRWTDISKDLPDAARIQSIGTLYGDLGVYAATDRGIYRLPATVDQTDELFGVVLPISEGPLLSKTFNQAQKSFRRPLVSDEPHWSLWSERQSRYIFNDRDAMLIHIVHVFNSFEVTNDGGRTYYPADTGMQNLFCGSLTTVNANGATVVYAGTGNDIRETSEHFSPDEFLWIRQIELGGAIFELTPDPSAPGTIYAGTEGRGVYKTTDYGDLWERQDNGVVPPNLTSIAEAASPGETLYAGTSAGVYVSDDGGFTWAGRAQNQNPRVITDVEAHPVFKDFVYYTTGDGTVYRSFDAGREFFRGWSTPRSKPPKRC